MLSANNMLDTVDMFYVHVWCLYFSSWAWEDNCIGHKLTSMISADPFKLQTRNSLIRFVRLLRVGGGLGVGQMGRGWGLDAPAYLSTTILWPPVTWLGDVIPDLLVSAWWAVFTLICWGFKWKCNFWEWFFTLNFLNQNFLFRCFVWASPILGSQS